MIDRETPPGWRALTPGQQIMMRRLLRDGSLQDLKPWEMRTVRSLLARGLIRPRRPGHAEAGLWFLSAKGSRIVPREPDPAWTEAGDSSDHVRRQEPALQNGA